MKTLASVAGCMIVLVAVAASVPLQDSKNHRSKASPSVLRNQLFDMASVSKRSMVNLPHPMRMQPQEQPQDWYPAEEEK